MKSALEHYYSAAKHWENKQLAAAIVELKQAIELEPSYKQALFDLGRLYCAMDHYDEALNQFEVLLQIYPNDATTYKYIGKLFRQKAQSDHQRENWNSAQEALNQALLLAPYDADALDELATVQYELGDYETAVKTSLIAATSATKNHRAIHNTDARVAQVLRKYISSGKLREALHIWKIVLASQKLK